jgi:hypothetical protein
MPSTSYLISAVLTCAVITWALRAVSFAVLAPLRQSTLVAYLGSDMPVGSRNRSMNEVAFDPRTCRRPPRADDFPARDFSTGQA